MADVSLSILQDIDWAYADDLLVRVGDEGAASLASSSPAGGETKLTEPAWRQTGTRGGFGQDGFGEAPFGYSQQGYGFGRGAFGDGAFGLNNLPRVELDITVNPDDVCAAVPVGVVTRDAPGNQAAVAEAVAALSDPPAGATQLTITSTGSARQARLTWTASGDV